MEKKTVGIIATIVVSMVWWLVGGGGPQGGGADLSREHILSVSYDDNGCINKHEIISRLNFLVKTVNEQVITWAGKGESLGKSVPMSIPEGRSVVYVLHQHNQYLGAADPSDFISGVFLDGKLWAELKGKQYAAMVLPPGTHKIGVEPRIRKSENFLDPQRKVQPEPWVVTTIDALPNKAYFLEITFYLDAIGLKPYFARPSQDEMLPKLAKAKRVR